MPIVVMELGRFHGHQRLPQRTALIFIVFILMPSTYLRDAFAFHLDRVNSNSRVHLDCLCITRCSSHACITARHALHGDSERGHLSFFRAS